MTSPTPDGTPTPEPATDPTQPRQLGRDASYVLGAQLVSIALGFALTAIASRNLDTADFAALSWAVPIRYGLALMGTNAVIQ